MCYIDDNLHQFVKLVDTLEYSYKIYIENGGPEISEEELNKADFQQLSYRNYVLYGKNLEKIFNNLIIPIKITILWANIFFSFNMRFLF